MSDRSRAFYIDCSELRSDPPSPELRSDPSSRAPEVILHFDLPARVYGSGARKRLRPAPTAPESSADARVMINDLRRKNENLDALVTKLQTELEVARAERDTWKKACDGLRECMLDLIKP